MTDAKFKALRQKLAKHFYEMIKDVDVLFIVNASKEEMWDVYMNSFPDGTNNIFRERREFECNACKHFINRVGRVVAIKNGEVHTIWDCEVDENEFNVVFKALDKFVKDHIVSEVWFSDQKEVWRKEDHEEDELKKIVYTWNHFYVEVPDKFVIENPTVRNRKISDMNSNATAFDNSLNCINMSAVDTVLELMYTNSLYKGEEYKWVVEKFGKYKKTYDELDEDLKRNWVWENSVKAGGAVCKIKNSAIGVLLTSITDGKELDDAVRLYGVTVDPENYKHSKTVYSKKQIEEAQKTITELGYLDSLGRRFATINDITVNNILWCNKDSAKKISGTASIFDDLKKDVATPKKLSNVQEITMNDFLAKVIPTAKDIELYLENKHESNMCSLIAPIDKTAPSMFKWNNPFSWAYSGNITDSKIKENVKSAGGSVTGILRFSIQWNDIGNGKDNTDLDAHCKTPRGEISYMNRSVGNGMLDIDITHPLDSLRLNNHVAVENITWDKMPSNGTYKFFVNNYSNRGNIHGFRAEIEFDGKVYQYNYDKSTKTGENINVANVTVKDGKFTIEEHLDSSMSAKTFWNVSTNNFVPVSVICYSPNYWDEQDGIGNRHLMFMLKDCINEESPNGFYNEYLKEELYRNHRRVFEALGYKCKVEDTDNQLSGVGFATTKRNDVIVKVKTDNTERQYKIMF